MSLNQKFTDLMKELRNKLCPSTMFILHGEALYAEIHHNARQYNLILDRYHMLKSLAHNLVYYSIKHGKRYNKISELCEKIRPAENKELFDASVEELMEMATKEYLSELHRVVQLVKDGKEWPSEMLCLVCGPASPRFGHPGMQYFARLANKRLEQRTMCQQGIHYEPADTTKYPGRTLFYIENAHSLEEAKSIGMTLLVEQKIMSQFADMSIDILAPNAMQHLQTVCGK